MKIEPEVKLIMGFPKLEIATALVSVRFKRREERKRIAELENQIEDIVSALGLIHENASMEDVMEHINRLRGVLTEGSDEVESIVEHMDM